ncbi:hypothetical protein AVEN_73203-1 [Araneus ventricosus]|uniref:Uncharacterized protein n=1 Tax=Araneus ventricosus TaxID=182803 RepID=A0A4Y1ZT81_ARAVE|nr:hypothetical protein AVEN_73203-1 [Araneus ventricosus]
MAEVFLAKEWRWTFEDGHCKPVTSSAPLSPANRCISFGVGAKEIAPKILSASEVGSHVPLCASIEIFRIPRMFAISKATAIPKIMSKSNVPAPQPEDYAKRRRLE